MILLKIESKVHSVGRYLTRVLYLQAQLGLFQEMAFVLYLGRRPTHLDARTRLGLLLCESELQLDK